MTTVPATRTGGRNVLSGVLFGLGVAAFVDETVFHQLLHWHHFYDKSTPAAGLVSDGVFHAFGFFCAVGALFLLADLRRRAAFDRRRWWGGLLAGAGAFQLYDGTIQHKLLHLHQIRYHVDLVPYDWTWNVIATLLLAAGVALLWRARRAGQRTADDPRPAHLGGAEDSRPAHVGGADDFRPGHLGGAGDSRPAPPAR